MDTQVCECELEKEEELKINTIAVASKKSQTSINLRDINLKVRGQIKKKSCQVT